jgi:hypothetical protein
MFDVDRDLAKEGMEVIHQRLVKTSVEAWL